MYVNRNNVWNDDPWRPFSCSCPFTIAVVFCHLSSLFWSPRDSLSVLISQQWMLLHCSFIAIDFLFVCHTTKESKVILRRWDTPGPMRSLRNSDGCKQISFILPISGSLYHLSKDHWHIKICHSRSLEHVIYRAFLQGKLLKGFILQFSQQWLSIKVTACSWSVYPLKRLEKSLITI